MRRIGLAVVLALCLFHALLAGEAQQPGMVPRIGILYARGPMQPRDGILQDGFRDLGYVEGRNITIERRYAEGRPERLSGLAAQLVELRVDIIMTVGAAATDAARKATKTIPIVGVEMGNPVQQGFVASLAQPGGNVTGLATVPGPEIIGKNLQLLKEAVPHVSRVAVLWNPSNPGHPTVMQAVKAAAQTPALPLRSLEARGPNEFDSAFSAMVRDRADALLVVPDTIFLNYRTRLVDLAAKHRMPAMYGAAEFPEVGGLMAYGPSSSDQFRRAAYFVDKILKGTKPAELPVEQPTKFELVINLKTAKALGLTIPQSVRLRADHVIE